MKYSRFLFPLQILSDVMLMVLIWFVFTTFFGYEILAKNIIISLVAWFFSIYLLGTYRVRRFSRIPKVILDLSRLTFIFLATNTLLQQAFFGSKFDIKFFLSVHFVFFLGGGVLRILAIKVMRQYRSLGKNYRNVVVLGVTPDTKNLSKTFKEGNDLGYRLKSVMSHSDYSLEDFKKISIAEEVNEVFISAGTFDNKEFNQIVDFADNNLIKIRIVPNFSGFFASNLKLDYVGFQPVLVHREIALDDIINSSIKRVFDIVFSSLVILGLLSWLMPLLAIIIKRESKGPVLFKQKRSGINNENFDCFKFRSMSVNAVSNSKQATKGDARITKVGAFLRKTSMDELPQFFNVFLGDMSVVGPRPHMVKHTREFSSVVDRYMLRHFVKPGITGLAQTMGFRGETKSTHEIKGRVTLDRFYIENWNFFLDIKIIYLTIVNGVRGEENAY
ncbi:MAG: putative colanic acid biosynthesis UDP-glucose lipid carrier transferase [Salibacteraceae bacterium]|jgi:putative colanic acid biosynthesis UDP-glucose lipid carrier transferase